MSKLDDLIEIESRLEREASGGNTIAAGFAGQLLLLIGALKEISAGGGSADVGALVSRVEKLEASLAGLAGYGDAQSKTDAALADAINSIRVIAAAVNKNDGRLSLLENAFSFFRSDLTAKADAAPASAAVDAGPAPAPSATPAATVDAGPALPGTSPGTGSSAAVDAGPSAPVAIPQTADAPAAPASAANGSEDVKGNI